MIKKPSQRYAYAAQYLHEFKKMRMYNENENVLKYYGKTYDVNLRKIKKMTRLTIEENTNKQYETVEKNLKAYDDLKRMKFKITSTPIKKAKIRPWNPHIKVIYSIVPNDTPHKDYGQIPQKTKIIYDAANRRIRLNGPNTGPHNYSPWTHRNPHDNNRLRHIILDPINDPHHAQKEILKTIMPYNKKIIRKIKVTEMPVLKTEYNSLICLPVERNEPDIGLVGQRGSGKSFMGHAITDHAFWKGGKKLVIMNDYQRECGTWCMPWDKKSQFHSMLHTIGEQSLPLPCVYLHPTTDTKKQIITNHGESGYKISFPYKELIKNFYQFSYGKKEWDLGRSDKYFAELKQSLLACSTTESVLNIIKNGIPDDKVMVRSKLTAIFKDIFDKQIPDIATQQPSSWTLENIKTGTKRKYNPITACLAADLVPIFVTPDVYSRDYFPQLFRYYANDIFTRQVEDEHFIQNNFKIWMFVDEITSIDLKRKPTVASEILGKIVAEGRPRRLGFMYATQNPEKISDRIATNTTHLFAFRFTSKKQAKGIADNFDMANHRQNELLNLKSREVLACTSQSLIEYDEQGRKSIIENEAVTGLSIPSLSMHKPPSSADT